MSHWGSLYELTAMDNDATICREWSAAFAKRVPALAFDHMLTWTFPADACVAAARAAQPYNVTSFF